MTSIVASGGGVAVGTSGTGKVVGESAREEKVRPHASPGRGWRFGGGEGVKIATERQESAEGNRTSIAGGGHESEFDAGQPIAEKHMAERKILLSRKGGRRNRRKRDSKALERCHSAKQFGALIN